MSNKPIVNRYSAAANPADLSLTPAARQHFLQQLSHHVGCQGVRVSLKRAGCSGWLYQLNYVAQPDDTDVLIEVSDELRLYIDRSHYPRIKGSVIDYVSQGLNAKVVFNNPNVAGECGCGESFSVKD